ncbi:hypothetical protein AVEN_271939-1 [Araneus ventricosus]|uniref:Uncharacterized protein n=1 Tax=Araneus ventricosus TaxID=182803 RepID=A0A4Y2CCZ3_ARAVE|nr:hypothetical protein AVEN_271939-1 [Araneus ventricosus]
MLLDSSSLNSTKGGFTKTFFILCRSGSLGLSSSSGSSTPSLGLFRDFRLSTITFTVSRAANHKRHITRKNIPTVLVEKQFLIESMTVKTF